MILLSVEKITKSYSEKKLLHDISLYINEGDKIGVIGINGTGKSTFLKMMAALEIPDSGTITKATGARIAYLPQNPVFAGNLTVIEQVFRGASVAYREQNEYEAKTILTRLGITDFTMPVAQMSGGEKKRVAIAGALIDPGEILILDEPTNHLDSDMVIWLENYLRRYTGAIIMVTHDRYFLDRVTNRIVEIHNGNIYSYPANYTRYLELKAQREEMALSTERKNQSLYRQELEWISRGAQARRTKSKDRIERFEKLRDREKPAAGDKLNLSSAASRLGKKTIEINAIAKAYAGRPLIRDFSHIVLRDARIGIIGPNGCGKSTLLKMIAGQIEPDSGSVVTGDTVKIGYFSQESEEMDTALRVVDYIRAIAERVQTADGTLSATQMLERFLFPPDLQYNTIGKLSGGERRRLLLLSVLMRAPNILLLDEPSNDLDIETLVILEDYLEAFNGAVIAVSHDRYFLDKVVERVFVFQDDGTLKQYEGNYTDYLAQSTAEAKAAEAKAQKKEPDMKADVRTAAEAPAATGRPAAGRKLRFTYKEQLEYEQIEAVIAGLEHELAQLDQTIEREATNYARLPELVAQKEQLEQTLAEKLERWVYLNDLAEKINL